MVQADVGTKKTGLKPVDLKEAAVDVYVVNAHSKMADSDRKLVIDFVKRGGGLMIGGQAWAWENQNTNPKLNFANGYPGNA